MVRTWVRDSSGFPKFFADDPSNSLGVYTIARLTQMLPQGLIDHRLVAPTCGVCALAKRLQYVVVQMDRETAR